MRAEQESQEFKRVAECLYRTGKGMYFALIKVKGKQIKKSLQTRDRSLANRRLSELRERAQRLLGAESRNIHFDELAATWLESIRTEQKPASHRRRRVAMNGLNPFFQGRQIRSITFHDIEEWKKQRGGTISARSHNIELETLRLLFRYAINKGILLDNPASAFRRRKQLHRAIQPLSRSQFSLLVRELRSSTKAVASGAADMIEFLAYSGMRIGEAREVRARDINFELKSIIITGGDIGTKNHRERIIPIFPNLESLLKRIMASKPDIRANTRLFQIDTPRSALELACKRTGLPRFTVHSLRHFFITNALEHAITPKTVAEWVGHSDGGILVAKTYGHVRKEFSEQAAQKMTFLALEHEEPLAASKKSTVL